LTAAFIPIFKEKEKTHGETEMWRAANAVISGLSSWRASSSALVMLGLAIALAVHQFSASTELMLQLLLRDVSLHAARVHRGGADGHAQCARPFFHSRPWARRC
jgi:hypothetical protein